MDDQPKRSPQHGSRKAMLLLTRTIPFRQAPFKNENIHFAVLTLIRCRLS